MKCNEILVKKRLTSNFIKFNQETGALSTSSNIDMSIQSKCESVLNKEEEQYFSRIFTTSTDIPHEVEILRTEIRELYDFEKIILNYLSDRIDYYLRIKELSSDWANIIFKIVKDHITKRSHY